MLTAVIAIFALLPATVSRLPAQSLSDSRDSIRAGRYASAIAMLARIPRSDSNWMDAQRELAQARATVGKYDEAELGARQTAALPGGQEISNTLGQILLERGKRAAAESAFVRAVAAHASDSLLAAVNIAILHYDRGDRDQAMKEFDRFIDVYNTSADKLTSQEFMAVAIACRYLGGDNPQLFKDALKAFDRAINADEANVDAKIALGNLFLEKYNGEEAQKTFEDALRINEFDPRALLGAARRLAFDRQPGADSLVARALVINPNFVEARTFRASLLLDIENYAEAQREIDRALAVNPSSLDALAVGAAIKYVVGDRPGFEVQQQHALALNPRDGELYATLADATSRVRLYTVAADFARQGVAVEPKNWRAFGLLGMNQLRLGQIAEGRKSLGVSFAGDPYNVWIKNTLDLLDTFKNYDLISDGPFQFMIEKDESKLMSIYMSELIGQAYETFQRRYGYSPPPPIRIEVYRSHTDFSVRTVGMGGIGALGVAFGTTLAFDSPAAKDAGPFNWGSTMWHELAHTFTLGMTDNRVPRWFSEGLSVYEEHHGKPGWGAHVSADWLTAFREGKLVPVSRMNDGFMRPEYPEQVIYSYFEASLVCDLIARDGGDKALVTMLQGFKAGESTEQVFQRVLASDMKTFDKKFEAYVRERFAAGLAAIAADSVRVDESEPSDRLQRLADSLPRNFHVQVAVGHTMVQRGEADAAIRLLERARALFPEFGGGEDGPYAWLAHAYEVKGNLRKAAEVEAQLILLDESDYKSRVELARLSEAAGDKAAAAAALDGALFINPFDMSVHQHLADLYLTGGDWIKVVRERKAVVAMDPVDRTEALYQLALAYYQSGDKVQARKAVIAALEEAPNYVKAQELLLTIVDGGKP
jgi:cellulose synthase operon protein C